jgi:uncharacterized protein YggU (UPF0235/DUF167 family)
VRVTPRAASDAVVGWRAGERAEGVRGVASGELGVRVSAAPEGGKANAAVIRVLARSLGIPKSAVSVVRGHTARVKTLAFTMDEQVYEAWKDSLPTY